MAAPNSKSFAPNLDAAERQMAMLPDDRAQTLLLRAGFLDVCMLLRDVRGHLETLNRNLQRVNRANDQDEG